MKTLAKGSDNSVEQGSTQGIYDLIANFCKNDSCCNIESSSICILSTKCYCFCPILWHENAALAFQHSARDP